MTVRCPCEAVWKIEGLASWIVYFIRGRDVVEDRFPGG